MAQVIACDMCGQEPAQVMQTNIQNGDVLSVGANCQLMFHLTVAAEMLDMMPADNRAAYADALAPVLEKLSWHAAVAADEAAHGGGGGVPQVTAILGTDGRDSGETVISGPQGDAGEAAAVGTAGDD